MASNTGIGRITNDETIQVQRVGNHLTIHNKIPVLILTTRKSQQHGQGQMIELYDTVSRYPFNS